MWNENTAITYDLETRLLVGSTIKEAMQRHNMDGDEALTEINYRFNEALGHWAQETNDELSDTRAELVTRYWLAVHMMRFFEDAEHYQKQAAAIGKDTHQEVTGLIRDLEHIATRTFDWPAVQNLLTVSLRLIL